MKTAAWAHLPDAKHIDWLITSLDAHPAKWMSVAYYKIIHTVAFDAAYDTAIDLIYYTLNAGPYYAAVNTAYYKVVNAIHTEEIEQEILYGVIKRSVVALFAYDDCGYMIETEVDEIKMLAKLGDKRAILLLPACIVFNEIKTLTKSA